MSAAAAMGGRSLALLRAMRPHQWVKNLFVLAPLVFARDLLDPERDLRALGAALLFSLLSGAVYLLNDLCDVEADRRHPVKRHRPIAAGDLPVAWAVTACAIFGLGSIVVGAWWLGVAFGATASLYLVSNVTYSLRLKRIAWVDVSIISTGFVLRVIAGAFAIDVHISRWLLICTLLLSLYLGLGKRLHELNTLGDGAGGRASLQGYGQPQLQGAMMVVALLTAVAYLGYTVDPETAAKMDTAWLPVTAPCIVFGLWRFGRLVREDGGSESPTDRMIRDLPFLVNLAIWATLVVALLY